MAAKVVLVWLAAMTAAGQVQPIATLPYSPRSIAVDKVGNIYTTTLTSIIDNSTNLPALNGYQYRTVVMSADGGVTWTPLNPPPTHAMVSPYIAADPNTKGALLVSSFDGIFRTTDGGAHWQGAGILDYGPMAHDPAVPGHVLSSSYYSFDGGETWSPQSHGENQSGPYAFDPRGNGTVLQPGGFGSLGNYGISHDGGRTWSVRSPPPSALLTGFAFDLVHPGVVYALDIAGLGNLWVSVDDGENFTIEKPLPISVGTITADPGQPGRLYAMSTIDIFRSDDGGNTWQEIPTTLYEPGPMVRSCGVLTGTGWFVSIRSTDNGDSWQPGAAVERITAGAGCLLYGVVEPQSVYLSQRAEATGNFQWGIYLDGARPVTQASAITVDAAGNFVVAGTTSMASAGSEAALTEGPQYQASDVWVAKLDPSGKQIYSISFGGDQNEFVSSVATDSAGNVYVAGTTSSANFPVTPNAAQSAYGGGSSDGFLAVVGANGALTYASFIGGSGSDVATGVGVDAQGRVTIGGYSSAASGARAAFLATLAYRGAPFEFSGSVAGADSVDAVALGSDASIYVTGLVGGGGFQVTESSFANQFNAAPAANISSCAGLDRFVLRLDKNLNAVYSALFGTNCAILGASLEIRPDGTAILQSAESDAFPHRAPLSIGSGVFWTEVSPDGSQLFYSGPLASSLAALAADGALVSNAGDKLEKVTVPIAPAMSIDHVANAFSGVGVSVNPGGLYTISGTDLGPAQPVWLGLFDSRQPIELGGLRVLFGDVPARLLYVSDRQIMCVAPGLPFSSVHVEYAGKASNAVAVSGSEFDGGVLTPAAPLSNIFPIFTQNADGSANGPDHPAQPGSTVVLYATGLSSKNAYYLFGVNVELDRGFSGKVYRLEATVPADAQPGTVKIALSVPIGEYECGFPGDGVYCTTYSYFGNIATVYVQ